MGFDSYLNTVRKLNNMGRWATEFMHRRTTVSEHSFFVAQIGQMLAIIEEQNGNSINWERLFKKLLNHDVIEAITGDIISTTKHKNKEISDLIDKLEKELAEENIFSHMESPYKEIYKQMLFDGKDDTLEGKILKYADNIDALIECIGEVKLKNYHVFESKYYQILDILLNSELTSVEYFIEKILPGMIVGCDRLSTKR